MMNQTCEYRVLVSFAYNRSRGCFLCTLAFLFVCPDERMTDLARMQYITKRTGEIILKRKYIALLLASAMSIGMLTGCGSDNSASTPTPTATPTATPAPAMPTPTPEESEIENFEEGTSPADDIVNTTAAEKVLLVVSFGTSFNESRSLTIGGIEAALRTAYPDYQVRRAFTSQIIIDKLADRDSLVIDNVEEALNRMVLDKVKEVVIQPTHVMSGFEYDDMIAEVMPFADKFESFKIGKNLLADDSDFDAVAEAIVAETASYRADDTAIVFMGHGTEHEAGSTYQRLQDTLTAKGYDDYIIGTVEHSIELDEVMEMLEAMEASKVVLRPLMVVAGDHANNDMAGDEEDSWKVILTEAGYEVETVVEGLGQIPAVQDLYIKHVQDAMDSDNVNAGASAAKAAGVSALRLANGTYPITVTSSTSMFKIVECALTVADDSMTAVMTLSGQGFGAVYMGTGEDALADSEENIHRFSDDGERHSFTVPVTALDLEMECSGLSIRKDEWYDHIVVFESANLPADAFIPASIDVTLVGGTGKASVDSPAVLTYADGQDFAEITWSSPNYSYMLINDIEYLPVNTEGNSVFVIPVVLGADMPVIACTTAMSTPKEIEYTLYFDTESIR